MAKPYASNRLDKSRVYWLLIAVSLLAFLDPWQLTDRLRDVAQILVPAQYTVFSATSRIRESFGQASAGLSDFDHDGDVDQDDWIALEAAHRKLAESQGRLVDTIRLWQTNAAELRRERDAALNLRPGEASRDYRFIPARIVAADVMAMRDRAIVDKGSVGGVLREDFILTRRFVDRGTVHGIQVDLAVIASEYLIGRVEKTSTYTSRIRLFTHPTDGKAMVRVQIARRAEAGFTFHLPTDKEFLLDGAGHGRMRILRVETSLWDEGLIQRGDAVLSSPAEPGLPAAMQIGTITGRQRDRDDDPQLCELTVTWPFDWATVREVYIVAPAWEE